MAPQAMVTKRSGNQLGVSGGRFVLTAGATTGALVKMMPSPMMPSATNSWWLLT